MTGRLNGFDQVARLSPGTTQFQQDSTVELEPLNRPERVTVHRADDHAVIDKLDRVGDVVNAEHGRSVARETIRFDHLTGGVETQSVDAGFE